MNGCERQRFFVRWRAVNPDAVVRVTTVSKDDPPTALRSEVRGSTGYLSSDSCAQPGFHMAAVAADGSNLTDVAVTYQVWTASA